MDIIAKALKQIGYKKKNKNFTKKSDGFYRLINIQNSSLRNCYYVNIALHPIGLPKLMTGKLIIKDNPVECECMVRCRIQQIVSSKYIQDEFGSFEPNDEKAEHEIVNSLNEIDEWFSEYANYANLVAIENPLAKYCPIVPIHETKYLYMVKMYACIMLNDKANAKKYYDIYLNEKPNYLDSSLVDQYLLELLEKLQ